LKLKCEAEHQITWMFKLHCQQSKFLTLCFQCMSIQLTVCTSFSTHFFAIWVPPWPQCTFIAVTHLLLQS
jgi:hypothetical protein